VSSYPVTRRVGYVFQGPLRASASASAVNSKREAQKHYQDASKAPNSEGDGSHEPPARHRLDIIDPRSVRHIARPRHVWRRCDLHLTTG
jgi:hypothetical protein